MEEMMGILKLKPSSKDYLWGGRRLAEDYGKECPGEVLAETWELSCHPAGPSYIENGAYAGKTLREYINSEGKQVLGKNCQRFEDFPILIKFIDAKDNLSIQVHPDNEYALKHEGILEGLAIKCAFRVTHMEECLLQILRICLYAQLFFQFPQRGLQKPAPGRQMAGRGNIITARVGIFGLAPFLQ